jgi:phosphoribosyl 1,2-cyclic phosphodiesterase
MATMRIRFLGTRGSLAAPDRAKARYGGHTACLEIVCGERHIIVDAGTGLRSLEQVLANHEGTEIDLILTHYHWDHIQAFPFFHPLFKPDTHLRVFGLETDEVSPEAVLHKQMDRPIFPIPLRDIPANITFYGVRPNTAMVFGDVHVYTTGNNHPGGCLGLRFEWEGSSFAHITDNEGVDHGRTFHRPSLELARGADLLSVDATFTEDEYHGRKDGVKRYGWGHATDEHAIRFGEESGAKEILLYHHAPEHTDLELDVIARNAREASGKTSMCVDGMEALIGEGKEKHVELIYPAGCQPRLTNDS